MVAANQKQSRYKPACVRDLHRIEELVRRQFNCGADSANRIHLHMNLAGGKALEVKSIPRRVFE